MRRQTAMQGRLRIMLNLSAVFAVLLVCWSAAVFACGPGSCDPCEKWDPEAGENGECVPDDSRDPSGAVDGDCGYCQKCSGGICVNDDLLCTGCESCNAGICEDDNGKCDPGLDCVDGDCKTPCTYDYECGYCGHCVDGYCEYSCSGEEVCVNDECVPEGDDCSTCEEDEICVNGECVPDTGGGDYFSAYRKYMKDFNVLVWLKSPF